MDTITCPSCQATLKIAAALPSGKLIKCPKCSKTFRVPETESPSETRAAPVRNTVKKNSAPARRRPAGDVVPKARLLSTPLRKTRPRDDDDEDERLQDDDGWDEDEAPPRRRQARKSSALLLLVIGGAFLLVLAAGGTVAAVLLLKRDKGSSSSSSTPGTQYTIVVKDPKDREVGKTLATKGSAKTTLNAKYFDLNGKFLKDLNQVKNEDEEYAETILEKGDKYPKIYQRTYTKSIEVEKGVTKVRSYQGRTVIFQLQPDQVSYQVSVEGQPPLRPEDQKELAKHAKIGSSGEHDFKRSDMLPTKPVAIDEEWTLNEEMLRDSLAKGKDDAGEGTVGTPQDVKGTGKLLKAYQKDGKQYGTIQFSMSCTVQMKFVPTQPSAPFNLEVTATTDLPIDGSSGSATSTMTWTMKGKIEIITDVGQKITAEMVMEMTGTEVDEEK